MAVLRTAHRVLDMGRKRLGLGVLGVGGNGVRAIAIVGLGVTGATLSTGVAVAYEAGNGATADQDQDVAVGDNANADGALGGPYAVAIGFSTDAAGNGTYNARRTDGLGFSDDTPVYGGTAVGNSAAASNSGSAFGSQSEASGLLAVAVGANTTASATSSAAFGPAAFATANHSLAVGFQNVASGIRSTAIGPVSTASGEASAAIGLSATASGEHALAFGSSPSDSAGQDTTTNTEASGDNSIAFGTSAKATDQDATAVGREAIADSIEAIAIGPESTAGGASSIAIGSGADGGADDTVALGTNAVANAVNDIAIGTDAEATGNANGSALAIGAGNVASGAGAVALGDPSTATGDGAIAQGLDSTATGNGTVALGNTAQAGGGGQDVGVTGTPAQGAVSIGYETEAVGQGSVALGNASTAQAAGSLAFGDSADASVANGVALGSASVADTAPGVAGYVPAGADATAINATESTLGAVSVGNAASGDFRQITGVAAGTEDSDAVNVSQLQAVEEVANTGWDLSAEGANTTNVAPGDTVDLSNTDGNIDISKGATDNDVTFDLADDITLDSATLGDTVLDTTGLSFATGGPSITAGGIDAGDTVITNVADGVNPDDAVNVSQLEAVETTANAGWDVQTNGDAATNVAPGDTVQLLDGQNVEITRTGTDITVATVADLTADSLTLASGQVFDSTGLDMNNTTITNLAPGTAGTDAVNLNQLEDAQTRYYSVNDGGTPGGNFNNDGATGLSAIAAGIDAAAAGDSGVALGEDSQADIEGSVALGSGAISDRAIAPATGTLPAGSATITYNTADHTLLGAVSVGDDTPGNETYRQITNVADGTNPHDAVTIRQLQGAMQSVTATGTMYFHANSTAGDSLAAGQESIAVGPTTVVNGDNGIGMGNGAIVDSTAPGGMALGQDSHVMMADGIAVGTQSQANGEQSVALGAGAQSDHAGSVALGSNSVTDEAVGTDSATINGTTYEFAGDTPVGTVSVGDTGSERTITNVAAGRISADSTDAINGSQLYATNTTIENLADDIGDIGDTAENSVQYDTNPDGSKANSITLQGGDPNAPVVISNVGPGVQDTDAVNVAQLDEGIEESMSYTDERVDYAIETSKGYTDRVAGETLSEAKAYTDQRFDQLNQNISEVRSEARQAAAIGLAAASLRFDDRPGKLSVSMGGGYWQSESALAFGAGYTSENGRVRANLTGTTADGDWGVGAGVSFTLN